MPRQVGLLLLATILSLLSGGAVLARAIQQGDNCSIPEDEIVEGTLFVFCQNLQIAGRVEGNLIGVGLRTTISGTVGENVYLAGLELDLTGTVNGDLHYVGLMLELASAGAKPRQAVRGQLIFAALSFALEAGTRVSGPIAGFGYQALIHGEIFGEVNYWGSALVLNNSLRGDVFATVGNPDTDISDVETLLLPLGIEFAPTVPGLTITEQGNIDGNLEYMGPAEASIDGQVAGEITHHSTVPVFIPESPQRGLATLFYDNFLREAAVLLTVGILGLALAGRRFHYPLTQLRRRPAHSFVIGMLLFIISFPITLILLFATMFLIIVLLALHLDGIALPIGAFLALVDFTVIGTFYFCAIFVARAIFALGLGRLVLQIATDRGNARRRPRLCVIIGAVLLAMLTSLPALGILFNAAALFLGLGAIASATTGWLRSLRADSYESRSRDDNMEWRTPEQPNAPVSVPATAVKPAPLLPADLGLDDLPVGFDPDFFFSDD